MRLFYSFNIVDTWRGIVSFFLTFIFDLFSCVLIVSRAMNMLTLPREVADFFIYLLIFLFFLLQAGSVSTSLLLTSDSASA